jgi:hypothetical protein
MAKEQPVQHHAHCMQRLLAQAEHELKHNTNRGPDDYYDCKARVLQLRAWLAGATPGKHTPMAWHHGFQSN